MRIEDIIKNYDNLHEFNISKEIELKAFALDVIIYYEKIKNIKSGKKWII